jgi:DMSO/TMAO reductase YedYZ molybdopterin-dependent catalytic subunit
MGGMDADVSPPSRIAESGEGISVEELRLSARNHGMPLEMLDLDLTPPGVHYLLTHYDIPVLDPVRWRLRIDGLVDRPMTLDLDAVLSRPTITRRVTLECAGNGRALLEPRPISQPWLEEAVGTAEWTGVPLREVLTEAGVQAKAQNVVFTGADHGTERGIEQDYQRSLSLDEISATNPFLAHTMNGQPLLPQHGAPLRVIVPGWYGMAQVKWLIGITVIAETFEGFQNLQTYRIKHVADEDGEPVTRILPRALVRPPGFPDFQTRTRVVETGSHVLTGRAWSGIAPIERAQVSVDGGNSWDDAKLDPAGDLYEWRRWEWTWLAAIPGRYELAVRATDAAGNTQPLEQRWNVQGMANNQVQRVAVFVRNPA